MRFRRAPVPSSSTFVHAWHDENWMDQRAKTDPHNGPVSIYEVHASSWRKDVKNYRELADKLVPYVQKGRFHPCGIHAAGRASLRLAIAG